MGKQPIMTVVDQRDKLLEKPLVLRQLEVLESRQGIYNQRKKQLWLQRTGFEGEQAFYEFIYRYAKPHWRILHRNWLHLNGRVECDFIIITRVGIYCFEIKNYNGNLIYEHHQQTINHRNVSGDILGQFKNMRDKTWDIFQRMNYTGDIQHYLVYINPYHYATLPQEWQASLLHYQQLTEFFEQMIRQETNLRPANWSANEVTEILQRDYICEPPYAVENISEAELSQLKKGIHCKHCGSFDTSTSRYKLICQQCGEQEAKEQAALRIITDYCLLFPITNLQAQLVYPLANTQLTEVYIGKILKQHFTLTPNTSRGIFINPVANN